MKIPKTHPRYASLMTREHLVNGVKGGLTALEGLMAHGRGEAFDYIIGEKTQPFAQWAMKAAVAKLLLAKHPILSVNGNVVALCPKDIVALSKATGASLEANIFYRTEDRVKRIVGALKKAGAKEVLGIQPDARIKGLNGPRARCAKDGIFSADVVLVPLEDGDRTQALVGNGKFVITVDLNPMSRTAKAAQITIVDNIVRAVPEMTRLSKELKHQSRTKLEAIVGTYDNGKVLSEALRFMSARLSQLSKAH
jgi:4-phosphopantoate---beta-alanine ligase